MLDYRLHFKQLRLKYNLTQSDVANICKVSQQLVSYWETLQKEMIAQDIKKLCEFYNVSADEVLEINIHI